MPSRDTLESFAISCPCCGAELVVDPVTKSLVHHTPAVAPAPITDLAAEVSRLKNAGAEREQAFQKSLEAERTREERMNRKFDELLKRARSSPDEKPVKDIDL
ncbi:MAG: hypothetical protein HYX27_04260 [Acidobacteria bacterium]|nr:hypothetical protein [Acidobacteriota bacterium]